MQRKTKIYIAFGVIVALGASVTGISYYTGVKAKELYPEFINKANESLQSLQKEGISVSLDNLTYERGIFTSLAKYDVNIKFGDQEINAQATDEIFHGPFPLNHLKNFNFIPQMISIDSVANGQTFSVNAKSNVDYSYNMNFTGSGSGILGEMINNLKFSGQLNALIAGNFNVEIPQVQLVTAHNALTAKNSVLNVIFSEPEANLPIKYQFSADNLNYENAQKIASLNNLQISGDTQIKERNYNNINLKSNISLANSSQTSNLGELNLKLNLDTNGKLLEQLENYLDSDNLKSLAWLKQIAQGKPSIKLEELSLTNSAGKIFASLNAQLQPMYLADFFKITKVFDQSKFNFSIDKNALELFLKQTNELDLDKDLALFQAQKQTAKFEKILKTTGLVVTTPTQIIFDLQVNNGRILLNNRSIPEHYLQLLLLQLTPYL